MPSLGLAVVAGYAIFLDYRADRYLLLEPTLNDAVCRLIDGNSVSLKTREELAEILGQHVSSEVLAAMLVRTACGPYRNRADVPASPALKIAALLNLTVSFFMLRVAGLNRSLMALEKHARSALPQHDASIDLSSVAAAHAWLSRHFTANDACLLRSIALARHAFRRGHRVRLVIGVKAHPFGAHCWVSVGNSVLNDDVDAVAPFEPILAIP